MTKILFLTDMISPIKVPVYEELSKRHDLEVWFCKKKSKDRKWDTSLKRYKFKRKVLKEIDIGPFYFNPGIFFKLLKLKYDLYIIGEIPESIYSNLITLFVAKVLRKPIIVLSGAMDNKITSIKFKSKIFKNIFERVLSSYRGFLYKNASSLLTYGIMGKKFILSYGINSSKIFYGTQILPQSILSKSDWKSKPDKFKEKNIIFSIGYLNERKGIYYLIKSFNLLNRKDTLLLIAGTGDQEERLKKLAHKNKNIIFLGYIDGVEKANYYSIADFFVFPTLYDCWGLVINESLYYGLPIISTNKAGGIELIENDKTGFIIPSKNTAVLAATMKMLLDNHKLLNQMKDNVKNIPKSEIVDVNTSVKTFERAINYVMSEKNER